MDQSLSAASGQDRTGFTSFAPRRTSSEAARPSTLSTLFGRAYGDRPYQQPRFFNVPSDDIPPTVKGEVYHDPLYDMEFEYYISRAPIERGVVVACTGLKEGVTLTDRVQALHDQGLSYICMRLMNPGQHRGFMPYYNHYINFFFLSPESPVHTEFPAGLKKFAQGHSTGGLGVLSLATRMETHKAMKDMYTQIHVDAPFLDTPHASVHDPLYQQIAFRAYAAWCGDNIPERTAGGIFYLIMEDITSGKISIDGNAIDKLTYAVRQTASRVFQQRWHGAPPEKRNGVDAKFRLPTYAQMLEIRQHARALTHYMNTNGAPVDGCPVHVYADPRDPYSSYPAIENYCRFTEATLHTSKGMHRNLNRDDEAFKIMTEVIESDLPAWPAPDRHTQPEKLPEPAQEKGWYALPPLHTILSASRERGASLLNATTGFFKNAFGRSVGNTEVRREPERRPVDTGHTFGF